MHNADKKDPLTEYIENALPVKEKPEPEGVQRERERQDALKARAEHVGQWKRYAAQDREPVPEQMVTGPVVKQLREACGLGVGELSEVLGVSPNDVQSYEAGRKTYADGAFKQFAAAARDALLEVQDGAS